MHLALAPRLRLAERYGAAAPAVLAALDEALAARAAAGHPTLAYDPEAGLPELSVAPAPLEQGPLVDQLRQLAAALAARGTMVASLWIVGGPSAVPFGRLPNPVPDLDARIDTDLVYGLADQSNLLPQWPVGRTPDAEPRAPGLLAHLLRLAAAAHRSGPRATRRVVALSAARWAAVSDHVLAGAGAPEAVHYRSPPDRPGGAALAGARVVYCNLHGVRGPLDWFGQGHDDPAFTPALAVADLAGVDLTGVTLVSQACYGARLDGRQDELPLALAALAAGAAATIAGHGLTYGAPEPPPSESDLLAQELIAALLRTGVTGGAALLAAQTALLRRLLLERGRLDDDEVKTLLGFVLYGDPALQLG